MKTDKPNNIDEYISGFPEEIRVRLALVRATIQKAAPMAEEIISYRMPAFRINGILVWFAAYSKHIGFYPSSSGIEAFKEQLSLYKGARGSVQFPLDEPLPLGLISNIVKFRVEENLQKANSKKR